VKNAAGNYPAPNAAAFAAAAAGADWAKSSPGNYVLLLNQPGANAWPISGATFILMHKNPSADAAASAKAVLKFYDWAYKYGRRRRDRAGLCAASGRPEGPVRKQWAPTSPGRQAGLCHK
jgi:phosphate transport system substrate-binding protein